jgi:hypothetical protein
MFKKHYQMATNEIIYDLFPEARLFTFLQVLFCEWNDGTGKFQTETG